MPSPQLAQRGLLLAKLESTYNTDASTAAADALVVENPQFSVDPKVLTRNFTRPTLSRLPHAVGRKLAKMSFRHEIRSNGDTSGTSAPKLTRLLRACGMALTSKIAADATALGPYVIGVHANPVTIAQAGTYTGDRVLTYHMAVTTGGASGTAKLAVTPDDTAYDAAQTNLTITSGTPITIGSKGKTVTLTFTGNLAVGQSWVMYVMAKGHLLQPVTGHTDSNDSVTLDLYQDGTQHKITGARGTVTVDATAGDYAWLNFEFTGQYYDMVDATTPASPVFETTLPSQVELAKLRLDKYAAVVEKMSFDIGNDVQPRIDANSSNGYNGVRIVGRDPKGGVDPEAPLVADNNFWSDLSTARSIPFQFVVGTVAGNRVWFKAPSTQYTGLTYQARNGLRTFDAGLAFNGNAGDDEVFFIFE